MTCGPGNIAEWNCIQRFTFSCSLPGCQDLVLRLGTSLFPGIVTCLLAKGQNLENLVAICFRAALQPDWEGAEPSCPKGLSWAGLDIWPKQFQLSRTNAIHLLSTPENSQINDIGKAERGWLCTWTALMFTTESLIVAICQNYFVHISEGKAPFMYVKNFIRVRASCLLALFCVTETKPKLILQPKEKLKPGKNPKVNSMAGGCPCLCLLCSGVCAALEAAGYQSRPTHQVPAWQMCWNLGEGWWPQFSPCAPFPDQDQLQGGCQALLGEQRVWGSWNSLPSAEICSCHPTPNTYKCLILV